MGPGCRSILSLPERERRIAQSLPLRACDYFASHLMLRLLRLSSLCHSERTGVPDAPGYGALEWKPVLGCWGGSEGPVPLLLVDTQKRTLHRNGRQL